MKNMILAIAYGLFLLWMAGMIVVNVRLTLLPVIIAIVLAIWMKPIVGLYLCVISDLWLSGIRFYGANPRTYIIIIIISSIFVSSIFRNDSQKEGKIDLSILLPPILLLFWGIFINALLIQTPPSSYIRWAITFFATFSVAIAIPYLINDIKKLKHFFYWVAFVLSISALVGILQFSIGEPFYSIQSFLGKVPIAFSGAIARPLGLSHTYINFSYDLLAMLLLMIGIIGYYIPDSPKESFYIKVVTAIIVIALLANFTRSAIGGAIAGGITIFLLTKERKKKHISIFVAIIMLLIAGIYASNITLKSYSRALTLQDSSALGRLPLFKLGFVIAKNNPLGVGSGHIYMQEAKKYYSKVKSLEASKVVLTQTSHNHYLLILSYYGIPGFFLAMWFLWKITSMGRSLLNLAPNPFLKGIGLGSIGFFVGYILNTSFHNAGFFKGDNFFWYVLGIILAAYNIVSRESEKEIVGFKKVL